MLKNIKLNLEAVEAIYFFWIAASERESVSEQFFHDIGQMEAMTSIYDDEFDQESVRRALSAIKNREPFAGNKKELKFWNQNMWAMEDFGLTEMMIQPLKKMNIDSILNDVDCDSIDSETVEVIFSPMHMEEYIIKGNKVIINFFRIKVDLDNGTISVAGKEMKSYITDLIKEMK